MLLCVACQREKAEGMTKEKESQRESMPVLSECCNSDFPYSILQTTAFYRQQAAIIIFFLQNKTKRIMLGNVVQY